MSYFVWYLFERYGELSVDVWI